MSKYDAQPPACFGPNVAGSVSKDLPRPQATAEQIELARNYYATDELCIDDDAKISQCDNGSYWVQAWVHMDAPMVGELVAKPKHAACVVCGVCGEGMAIVLGIASAIACGKCDATIILGEDPNG